MEENVWSHCLIIKDELISAFWAPGKHESGVFKLSRAKRIGVYLIEIDMRIKKNVVYEYISPME